MSSSWRVQTKFVDQTERSDTSIPIFGATAINALKGPKDWFFFEKGETQKIVNTYGYPTKDNPTIQDAIDFNLKTGIFISAPYKTGAHGGVFITKDGTIPFVSGTSTKVIADYSAIPSVADMAVADGVAATYALTLPNFEYYVNQSIDILVDGISINVAATDASTEILTTDPDLGTGTYDRTTGELAFNFSPVLTAGSEITVSYNINLEDNVYVTLFSRDQQADDLKVLVTADPEIDGNFNMNVYRYIPTEKDYFEINGSPFNFSIDPLGKDGFGTNIYIENIFDEESQALFTPVVVDEVFTTFVDDTTSIPLTGGLRGVAIEGTDLAAVYDDLKDKNKYPVKIIFDGTAESAVATKFEQLRLSDLTRTRFMLCTENLSATALLADPDTAANGTTDRGIYYYCLNWGIHKDSFLGKNFLCSNMGLIAGKMADVLILGPGGNPAWIDENGKGGQLGGAITKFIYSATESQLQLLDKARLNPVVFDRSYGNIIKSWRTRQTRISDYAYIAQSSLADWTVERIESEVLPYQLGKEIDDFHMSIVKNKTDQILASVQLWLEDSYTLCDRTNNTAETRAQQRFILTVGVTFVGYANTIEFTFINSPAGTSVEEVIKKQ
ncbi:MAG: hypothetical protein AB7V16_07325 [Vulcanibacillus sp.]